MGSRADELLVRAKANVGDRVRIEDAGRVFEGLILPRHAFSAPDVVILKLGSGYNVGIQCSSKASVTVLERPPARPAKPRPASSAKGRARVAILGTGGTIASYVDYRTGAVHPAGTAEELAFATPELFDVADVEAEVVYQVFSEDLEPKNWSELATRVKAAFDRGVRGVVIPHGTDTLHYTAAALSFALSNLPGPVVLVGAQRSSDRPSSDAAGNLVAAARVAAEADVGEVVLVMHEGSSDETYAILRGTRARKNHTSRRDAFVSVNAPPLGRLTPKGFEWQGSPRPRAKGPAECRPAFDAQCRLVWSSPLTRADEFEAKAVRGFAIAGTGLGHVPRRTLEAVEHASKSGAVLVMTSQCLWGRVNLDVYSTGRDLLARGVVAGEDMLPEVALVKLMWLLANEKDAKRLKTALREDLRGEIAPTTPFETGTGASAG